MFLKRQLPVYIMVTIGVLTLLGHFIKGGFIDTFIKEDSLNWFNIIASFAILLGAFNLLKIHFIKFSRKQKDWQYSIIALLGFGMMIVAGFFFRGGNYLKIEINSNNIDKFVKVVSDFKYELDNEFIDSVDGYFSNNLISRCYGSTNQKLDYFDIEECYDNNGVWENRQIDPKEFNRPIYNEGSIVLDDGFSSELRWMIYDYLEEVSLLKKYENLLLDDEMLDGDNTIWKTSYDVCLDAAAEGEVGYCVPSNKGGIVNYERYCNLSVLDQDNMRIMSKEDNYCSKSLAIIKKQISFLDFFVFSNSSQSVDEHSLFPYFSSVTISKIISKYIEGKKDIRISKLFNKKSFSHNKLNNMVADFNKVGLPNFISVESVEWGKHVEESGTFIKWLFDSIYSPLDTTMFALLAFFVASASYRAFRIRNFEASLLLIAGVLVMVGAIPAGALIPSWFFVYLFALIIFAFIAPLFKDKQILFISLGSTFAVLFIITLIFDLSFLNSKDIMAWIIKVPTVAGKKAIMIGVALGIVATSLRIIFGRDKSFLGD
mgnify:CR=1 FL=1